MAQHLARQEEQSGPKQFRSVRNPNADTYVPTFFTSQQNHAALSAARPNVFAAEKAGIRGGGQRPAVHSVCVGVDHLVGHTCIRCHRQW